MPTESVNNKSVEKDVTANENNIEGKNYSQTVDVDDEKLENDIDGEKSECNDEQQQNNTPINFQDLINEKHKANIADQKNYGGNVYNYFGWNTHGDLKYDVVKSDTKTNNCEQSTEYDLKNAQGWSDFVSNKKIGGTLTLAILLCLLDYVPMSDLEQLRTSLLSFLPENPNKDAKIAVQESELYVSLESMLTCIGAQRVEVEIEGRLNEVPISCVQLETREDALQIFWEQYPFLRHAVVGWIVKTIKGTNAFVYRGLVRACSDLVKLDFGFGVQHIINKLAIDRNSYHTLCIIFQNLYEDKFHEDALDDKLDIWSEHPWLWRVSCICTIHNLYPGKLKTMLDRRLKIFVDDFQLDDRNLHFIGQTMHYNKMVRSFTADLLSEYLQRHKARDVVMLYIALLYHSYLYVDNDAPELALLVCDSDDQLERIVRIVKYIIPWNDQRNLFFDIIQAYLQEFDRYSIDIPPMLLLFFRKIAFDNKASYLKIQKMLSSTGSKTAQKISEYLDNLLKKATSKKQLKERNENNGK